MSNIKETAGSNETADMLTDAGRKFAKLQDEKRMLLNMITDSYKRQATNTSPLYREEQMAKVDQWLARLTKMFEERPQLWTAE